MVYLGKGLIKPESNNNRRFNSEQLMRVEEILNNYVNAIKSIYGSHLRKVILYGSYARGDYNESSDVDIMILLDISDLECKDYQDMLFDMTYDINFDNNVEINAIAKSEDTFNKWLNAYPFYQNIQNEGVVLYGAA